MAPGGEILEAEKKDGEGAGFTVETKVAGVVHYINFSPKGDVTWHGIQIPGYVDITLTPGAALPAGDANPGHIEPELLTLATKAKGAEKMKIRTNAAGEINKVSLYHHDEANSPQPVRATAATKFAGSKLLGTFESEMYSDLGKVFEADLTTADNKKCEVAALASGTFVYSECEIKKEDLPAAVTDAVKKVAPGAEIVEVEKKEGPGGDGYSVEAKGGGQLHYIKLSSAGEITWHGVRITAKIEITVP